jgi:glycerol kinase
LLFNIHTLKWDEELLTILDIPPTLLPQVVHSSGIVGHTDAALFGAPIPIAGIAGDQQAATFGQACHRAGMAKNTYGTGCFMLMNTGKEAVTSHNNLVTTIGWSQGREWPGESAYMLEGSVFMAGAAVQWLRDGLGIIERSSDVEALAASVPDTGGVVFVPAFAGLGAPYWDAYARGTIVGMTRGTTKAHIARATLASIAYQSADVLEAMQKDAAIELKELRVDGGAARNDLLMQFQADVLGVPVVRPVVTETTALGAAYLAGLAVGFWASPQEIRRNGGCNAASSPPCRKMNAWSVLISGGGQSTVHGAGRLSHRAISGHSAPTRAQRFVAALSRTALASRFALGQTTTLLSRWRPGLAHPNDLNPIY